MNVWPSLTRGDLVLAIFPCTDLTGQKLRPSLVLSSFSSDIIIAFITSRDAGSDPRAEYVLDPSDPEFGAGGLKLPSIIRLNKLATVERRLVQRRLGRIGPQTRVGVATALRHVFLL